MGKLIIRLFINAVALWGAAFVVDGMQLTDRFLPILVVAAVFGLVNALIKPVVTVLTFPLLILTLGLLTFVINALMLALTAWLTPYLDIDGFLAAFLGALVISMVSFFLSLVAGGGRKEQG